MPSDTAWLYIVYHIPYRSWMARYSRATSVLDLEAAGSGSDAQDESFEERADDAMDLDDLASDPSPVPPRPVPPRKTFYDEELYDADKVKRLEQELKKLKARKGKSQRENAVKHWCFTYNNPIVTATEFLAIAAQWKGTTYGVFQVEEGGKTHTRHFQGYVEFGDKKRKTWLCKLPPHKDATSGVNTISWEARRGTRNEARDYCMDASKTVLEAPKEWGKWIPGDNSPNRFLEIASKIRSGATELQIATDHPEEYVKFCRGINKLIILQVRGTRPGN